MHGYCASVLYNMMHDILCQRQLMTVNTVSIGTLVIIKCLDQNQEKNWQNLQK
jgi:hypothetical protein